MQPPLRARSGTGPLVRAPLAAEVQAIGLRVVLGPEAFLAGANPDQRAVRQEVSIAEARFGLFQRPTKELARDFLLEHPLGRFRGPAGVGVKGIKVQGIRDCARPHPQGAGCGAQRRIAGDALFERDGAQDSGLVGVVAAGRAMVAQNSRWQQKKDFSNNPPGRSDVLPDCFSAASINPPCTRSASARTAHRSPGARLAFALKRARAVGRIHLRGHHLLLLSAAVGRHGSPGQQRTRAVVPSVVRGRPGASGALAHLQWELRTVRRLVRPV